MTRGPGIRPRCGSAVRPVESCRPRVNRTANKGRMGIDETRERVALAHHTAGWLAHTVQLNLKNPALWSISLS